MTTPSEDKAPEQVATPTVSTAPTSGTAEPPRTSWWHWDALPHHLGRARTSTVILSVLFLAIFTLYLNVRPDAPADPGRTSPAGGGSGVEAPLNPVVPTEPTTTPEPTEEPTPTTEPEETETPSEETDTPTTSSTPSTSAPGTTDPTTEPTDPTETSEPSETTGDTSEPSTSAPSTSE
ncbi:hypothetical protein SAMN05660662_3202 [Blastococcus aurantiacus]|uniref:Uncharacterized protein n=1 Tax=Blastococcus aurantiacus TaxID=1550231 RepID=A0A1G7NLV9_9ACTN|nr:hypothetical protein [Blastococcus aurantiacus]SDF74279.1 hypothetical protein SAMN05660662_3202 [Blastococcus aurantiacus]